MYNGYIIQTFLPYDQGRLILNRPVVQVK